MCGLFGFFGTAPSREYLATLAEYASRRGPHGCGVAHFTGTNWTRVVSPFGRIALPSTSRIIGHYRLATHGDYDDANLQPVVARGIVLAHNGNLDDVEELRSRARLGDSASDTRALASSEPFNSARDLLVALTTRAGNHPIAAIVADDTRAFLVSRGLPLNFVERSEGTYVCSWPVHESQPVVGIAKL